MHWDTIIVAVIAAVPAIYASWLGHRNTAKIAEVHFLINSRMSQLIESAKLGAFGEGQQKERDDQARKDKDKENA